MSNFVCKCGFKYNCVQPNNGAINVHIKSENHRNAVNNANLLLASQHKPISCAYTVAFT